MRTFDQRGHTDCQDDDLSGSAVLDNARVFLGAAYLGAGMGGISRVARLTARVLIDAGAEVHLLSLLDVGPEAFGAVRSHVARGSKVAFAASCAGAALRRRHFIYDQAGIGRGHARVGTLKRPFAVWMHGIEVWEQLKPEARAVLAHADARFVNSHYTLARYRELHGDDTATGVCWLATEDDEAPAAMPRFDGPPCVLLLARIDELAGYKGHAEIIDAWPHVVSAVPRARLVFAGGGAGLGELRAAVARSPAASSIEVTGFVSEADLPRLWQRAHVLAMPSRKEGFGLVYIEAMRHALPVVASIHDAGQEVNVDGETGFNIDLGRANTIADVLIALLSDTHRAVAMGQAGHARWSQHFRFSAFARRFSPLLADFVAATS